MKKILALLLAGVMTVGLAACGTPADTSGGNSTADNGSAASGDTVVIGVFEPLSGDNGAGGKQEVLGMQYANSVTPTVEIGGKTYNVKLEVVDNESSNDKAVLLWFWVPMVPACLSLLPTPLLRVVCPPSA